MRSIILVVMLAIVMLSPLALAQIAGGSYVVNKSTLDGGGGAATGGAYILTGTIGQADASNATSSGGQYRAAGGFWATLVEELFKDGFESAPE